MGVRTPRVHSNRPRPNCRISGQSRPDLQSTNSTSVRELFAADHGHARPWRGRMRASFLVQTSCVMLVAFFFLGILGERYGWIPNRRPADALKKFGWIQHHKGKSVTELEILRRSVNMGRSPATPARTEALFRERRCLMCMALVPSLAGPPQREGPSTPAAVLGTACPDAPETNAPRGRNVLWPWRDRRVVDGTWPGRRP